MMCCDVSPERTDLMLISYLLLFEGYSLAICWSLAIHCRYLPHPGAADRRNLSALLDIMHTCQVVHVLDCPTSRFWGM